MMRRMPSLAAMRVFETVGLTGSFTRAAERLNLTQSAVSRQVKILEDQLGEPLLIRHHHRLELTPAGHMLLNALGRAFHEVELALRGIEEESNAHRLRVNAPPTLSKRWLVPRLNDLRRACPDIDISLTTDLSDSLAESSLLDCAIRFGDGEWPAFNSVHLMTERHVAVCAPSLIAGLSKDETMDLTRFTFLHVLASSDQRYLTWRHWLNAAGLEEVDTSGGLEFDLLDTAIEAAVCGLGITVADRHMVARELADGRLVQILDVEVDGHESYWLVTRQEKKPPRMLAAFCAWLTGQCAGELRPGQGA